MGCCVNIKIAESMNKRETSLSVRLKLIGRRKIKIYRRCIHVIRKANEEDIGNIIKVKINDVKSFSMNGEKVEDR